MLQASGKVTIRGVLHENDDIEKLLIDFLRDNNLNPKVSELLMRFNSSVVAYAPTLDEITLQDIIVAYQNGKLSEHQMNSVEGFLNFAGAFLDIRLAVISSVEKETTSQFSDLTDAEKKVLEDIFKERIQGMRIQDFSGIFTGTIQKTGREILKIDSDTLKSDSGNPVQERIRAFIETIQENIRTKRQPISMNAGDVELFDNSDAKMEEYIAQLLDTNRPLDKELLKATPLDLSFDQQRRFLLNLIRKIFPDVGESLDIGFIANSLNIFPNVGGKNGRRTPSSRGFQFGKSISISYLRQILGQENSGKANDKFLTTALRRIIVPLRFLIIKGQTDREFLEGKDNAINVLPSNRLTQVLADLSLEDSVVGSNVRDIASFFLTLPQESKREFLRRLTAAIVGIPLNKIDFTNIDYIVNKYVGGIPDYTRVYKTNVSQYLKDNASNNFDYNKAREVFYALACLRSIKELDTQADIAIRGDSVNNDAELQVIEQAHAAEAEKEAIRLSQILPESESPQEKKLEGDFDKGEDLDVHEKGDELDFFIELCTSFESTELQYKDDIDYLIRMFEDFSSEQRNSIFTFLELEQCLSLDDQKEKLQTYLYKKFLENSDLCTKMIHTYQFLKKGKNGLDDSIKQRDVNRILQGFSELNSQEQIRFLKEIEIEPSEKDNLSDILFERICGIDSHNDRIRDFSGLKDFFEHKIKGIQAGTITKDDIKKFSETFLGFRNAQKKTALREIFGSILERGCRMKRGEINKKLGITIKEGENDAFLSMIESFLSSNNEDFEGSIANKLDWELLIKLFAKNCF